MFPAALLIALLGSGWLVRRHLRLLGGREAAYASAVLKQLLGFALPALVALALLGRLDTLAALPREFRTVLYGGAGDIVPALSTGALVGTAIGAVLARRRWHRTGRRGPLFGELGWLIPRDRRDLGWATVLALTAGIAEELYFRLALPLLATLASGSLIAGQALALIAFAAVHRYQGRAGVIATGVIGLLFTALYLASGSLWLVVAAHMLVDLNSLVLLPAITGAWQRR